MSKISVTTIAGLTSGGDANTVKIESGDTLAVQTNATVGGTLGVTGVSTLNGGVVLNENSADVDFRVESDANTHALFLEGSTGNIGIGTSSPPSYGSTFTVFQANNTGSGIVQANNSTNSVTTEIEAEGTRGAVGTRTNHDFVIKTNQTERARIDTSGDLMVGKTSNASSGSGLVLQDSSSHGGRMLFTRLDNTSTQVPVSFYTNSGTGVGSISNTSSSTSFNTSSDYRLKENITYDFDATTRLKQLKPSRFNFKIDKDTTLDGFLAHEVSSIVPEAITGEKDAVDKEGNPEYQGIDQSKLVPLMVKTIQELEARLTALESK